MTTRIDNRSKYQTVLWQQGYFLGCSRFAAMTDSEVKTTNYLERCQAYIDFTAEDMGISRELVYHFNSPKECAEAVKDHNRDLKVLQLLLPKTNNNIRGSKIYGTRPTQILYEDIGHDFAKNNSEFIIHDRQ